MTYALIQVTVKADGTSEFGAARITPNPDGTETQEALGEHELMALLHHALAEYHRSKQTKTSRLAVVMGRG